MPCTEIGSAGHAIGSANWTLASMDYRVAIVGGSCLAPILRHPLPMRLEHLQHVDVAIFGDLMPLNRKVDVKVLPNGSSTWQTLMHVAMAVKSLAQDGGNVLLPLTLGSTSMDIIDALGTGLSGDAVTSHIPIYVVSPVARNVLGYCEILSEWLRPRPATQPRDAGIHTHFQPESPFIHEKLEQSGRLHVVSDEHALRAKYLEPCIVLAGHPSLRMGPCLHFLKRSAFSSIGLSFFFYRPPARPCFPPPPPPLAQDLRDDVSGAGGARATRMLLF